MSAVGEAWAANLEQQVGAWKAARSERTSATEAGVLVVRLGPDAFAKDGQRFIGIDTCAPDHRGMSRASCPIRLHDLAARGHGLHPALVERG